MMTRTSLIFTALLTAAAALSARPEPARCETLRDVVASRAMRKVDMDTEKARKRRDRGADDEQSWFNGMDSQSNFASIWATGSGASLPISWIGANIPEYKLMNTLGKRYREMVLAQGTIMSRSRVPVRLDILIPHPTYRDMVKYKTLAEFNRFEPPSLRVVASEEMTINGEKAMYFRSERGQCSVLFKAAQTSIVNLSVPRCENSQVLMDVAKALDFSRYNKKLNS